MEYPGGNQMRYLGQLLASRPGLSRIPDQSMIVASWYNPRDGATTELVEPDEAREDED